MLLLYLASEVLEELVLGITSELPIAFKIVYSMSSRIISCWKWKKRIVPDAQRMIKRYKDMKQPSSRGKKKKRLKNEEVCSSDNTSKSGLRTSVAQTPK